MDHDESSWPDEVAPTVLASALDGMDDPVLVCEPSGAVRYGNTAADGLVNAAEEPLSTQPLPDLVAPDDRSQLQDELATVPADSETTIEVQLQTDDRDHRPVEIRLTPVPREDEDGALVSAQILEPSERAPMDRECQAILDRMTDAFYAVDENWRLTYVNDEAASFLAAAMAADRDPDDLAGLHLWEEIPDAVDTSFYENQHRAMERQEPVTIEEYYEPLDTWFELRAYPSESGLSVYFRDVSEQRRQRDRLAERDRALRESYEVTANPSLSFHEQVQRLLEIGCDVMGVSYGTLSRVADDDYVFEVVHAPDDSITEGDVVSLSATNCERTVSSAETVVLSDVATAASDLTDRAGYQDWGISCYLGAPVTVGDEVYGTFCFYDEQPRDGFSEWEVTLVDLLAQWVSYELTQQQALDELERRNEQLDEFASIVSHDLRNPLSVVSSSLELAQETGDADHFERARRALDRMEGIIDDVLTLARAGDVIAEPEPIDLTTVARAAWESVDTAEATLVVESAATIQADQSRLRALLENLFRNALEHGGSDVTVTVADADGGFAVADDGSGFGEDDPESLFEPGYSTTDDGTGFGLSIVTEIATAHGWTVSATTSEDGGARFVFGEVDQA